MSLNTQNTNTGAVHARITQTEMGRDVLACGAFIPRIDQKHTEKKVTCKNCLKSVNKKK